MCFQHPFFKKRGSADDLASLVKQYIKSKEREKDKPKPKENPRELQKVKRKLEFNMD